MTATADTFTRVTRTGQETAFAAAQLWRDAVRAYTGATKIREVRVPDVQAAVDATFDLAERVLGDQREFTKALLSQGAQAFEAMAEQATHTASRAAETSVGTGRPSDDASSKDDATKATSA